MSKLQRKPRLIPLSEAPLHFASKKLLRDLKVVESTPHRELLIDKTKSGVDAFRHGMENISATIDEFTKSKKPIWNMERELIERLRAGELEAWGIRTKPTISVAPEKIPSHIFRNLKTINWKAETLENFGQRFEGIEIGSSILANKQIANSAQKAKQGRQSKSIEIESAIDGLLAEGLNLRELPRDQAYEAVRKYASTKLGAKIDIGYSTSVIQRCLKQKIGIRS